MNNQRIRGKQLLIDRNIDINQNVFQNSGTPVLGGDLVNKAWVEALFCYLNRKLVDSKEHLDMQALPTANNGDLACSDALTEKPESYVRVYINGVEVNVTVDAVDYLSYDGYFKSPTGTIRSAGEEQIGDKFYWNGSIAGYQLTTTDLIDFQYEIYEDTYCPPVSLPSPTGISLTNDGYTYSLTVGTDTVVWYKDIDQLVDLAEISPNKYKLTVDNREVIWSNDMSLINNSGTYTLRIDGQVAVWEANPQSNEVTLVNGGNGNYSLTVDGQTVNFNINGMGNPMNPTTSSVLLLNDGAGHYSLTVDSTTVNWSAETDPQVSVDTISPGVYALTVRGETIQWTDLSNQSVLLHDNGDHTAELTVNGDTVTVLLENYAGGGSGGGGSTVTAVNNGNGTTTFTVDGIPYTVIRVEQDPTFTIVDNGTTGTITNDGQNFSYVEQETDPTIQFINNNNGTATLVKGIQTLTVLTAGGGSSGNVSIVNNNNGTYTISNGTTSATLLSAYSETDPNVHIVNNNNGTYTVSNGSSSATLLGTDQDVTVTDNNNGTVTVTKNSNSYILTKNTYTTLVDNNNNTVTLTVNGLVEVLSKPAYTTIVDNGNGTATVTIGTTAVNVSTRPTQLTNNPNGTATLQVGNVTSTLLTQEFDPNITLSDNGNNTVNLTVQGLTKTLLAQGFALLADNGNGTYNLSIGNTSAIINKGNIDGSGNVNFLPVFTDSDTIANSFVSQSSTEVTIHKNLVPVATETYNLGSTAEYWENLYLNNTLIFNDAFAIKKMTGTANIISIDNNEKVYFNVQGDRNLGSILLSNGNGELIWTSASDFIDANDLLTPVLSFNDKDWVALATTANGQLASNSSITDEPLDNSYISVMVNGITYLVGNADKTKDCYFSSDNGVTAKSFSSTHANGKVTIGDKLYWNSLIIEVNLTAGQRISVNYMTKNN